MHLQGFSIPPDNLQFDYHSKHLLNLLSLLLISVLIYLFFVFFILTCYSLWAICSHFFDLPFPCFCMFFKSVDILGVLMVFRIRWKWHCGAGTSPPPFFMCFYFWLAMPSMILLDLAACLHYASVCVSLCFNILSMCRSVIILYLLQSYIFLLVESYMDHQSVSFSSEPTNLSFHRHW